MTIFGNQIKTPRLILRKTELHDVQLLCAWSHSEVAHGDHLTPERSSPEQELQNIVAGLHWTMQNRLFLIETRENQAIGTIHYWLRPEMKDSAVVAVKIAVAGLRNKGYGTEAQKYLINYLLGRGKVNRVEMYTDIDNLAQQRCLDKLGFMQVDSLQYVDGGVSRIGFLYRLDRQRYQAMPIYHFHYEESSWPAV